MRSGDSSQLTIRQRTAADLDACVRVLSYVHRQDGYPTNWPDDPRAWLANSNAIASWVVEIANEVVGHVGLARCAPEDVAPDLWALREGADRDKAAVITRLFVKSTARGRGVATALMKEAERHARQQRTHPVLDVVEDDASAIVFYERLGWGYLGSAEQRWGPDQMVTVRCYAAPLNT